MFTNTSPVAFTHVTVPVASDRNTLSVACVPSTILMFPATCSFAVGSLVPIPTFCALSPNIARLISIEYKNFHNNSFYVYNDFTLKLSNYW